MQYILHARVPIITFQVRKPGRMDVRGRGATATPPCLPTPHPCRLAAQPTLSLLHTRFTPCGCFTTSPAHRSPHPLGRLPLGSVTGHLVRSHPSFLSLTRRHTRWTLCPSPPSSHSPADTPAGHSVCPLLAPGLVARHRMRLVHWRYEHAVQSVCAAAGSKGQHALWRSLPAGEGVGKGARGQERDRQGRELWGGGEHP
eukprot:363828-Chlamydomonas_euryale.AAC.7